jgi:glycosyltransferase involved in cell wall biosynthesis
MRVVYLSPSAQLGGAEISLLDMVASLRAAAPEWHLHLVVAEDGPLAQRAAECGVKATVLPLAPALARLGDAASGGPAGKEQGRAALLCKLLRASPATYAYARRLRRTIRGLNADVIHSNGLKMHALAAWAKPRRVPLVWHVHDYLSARPVMGRLLGRLAGRCAAALANSASVAEDVRALCGPGLKVRTVYNGIDVENFSPAGPRVDLDALAGLPPAAPETVRVGMLATLARWKGHQTFLRALASLPPDLPVRGYVVGGALYRTDGSQHSLGELKEMAKGLGISDRVGFTGFLDRPADAVRALDVVVHASTRPEPFGLVIAEGMACGRAVIVSGAGGASELIEADVNALSHTPGDADGLAGGIIRLASDRNLRARLGAAGRATAERRFDRARLAAELIPIYQALTNGSNLHDAS